MSASNHAALGSLPQIDIEKVRAERKVGIAYSGGGDRFIVEVGIAQAFIELGIVPDRIAGVSAGAFAGAFHALDPNSMYYLPLVIKLAQKGVPTLRPSALALLFQLVPAALSYLIGGPRALHLQSLISTAKVRRLLAKKFPVKSFGSLAVPLSISATDLLTGEEIWFDERAMDVVPALLASSAIPGLFPPVQVGTRLCVDGSVSDNLPLFRLAQEGCSTIYACDVSYAGERNQPPRNLLDTLQITIGIGQYSATQKQKQVLELLYPEIRVIPVRPTVAISMLPTDLRTKDFPTYVAKAAEETTRILQAAGVLAGVPSAHLEQHQ